VKNKVYVVALILVIGWLVGYFGFHMGSIIHVLLIIALVTSLLAFGSGKKTV